MKAAYETCNMVIMIELGQRVPRYFRKKLPAIVSLKTELKSLFKYSEAFLWIAWDFMHVVSLSLFKCNPPSSGRAAGSRDSSAVCIVAYEQRPRHVGKSSSFLFLGLLSIAAAHG